jgi:hypothetical protein
MILKIEKEFNMVRSSICYLCLGGGQSPIREIMTRKFMWRRVQLGVRLAVRKGI